ncbi:MAG: UDP-N-acetylenolpyruvoylglucosamine reductase [Anaerolineaceae bacterium]|nr:UDP-N-acetylenolpyruvoylglucosamine reductase [Anaerolineaceae bacterium]
MSQFGAISHNLQRDVPLAKYTAARLGGPAEWFFRAREAADYDRLNDIVMAAWADDVPVRVLGKGSNVLISDKGVPGLVVVDQVSQIDYQAGEADTWQVQASAGTGLIVLARGCQQRGIAGMSWAVGVPGTVGGAIVNNAGAHGDDMAASQPTVIALEHERGLVTYTPETLEFAYRSSTFKHRDDKRFLVRQAMLTLPAGDPMAIKAQMDEFNAYRVRTQPPGASLGSIFKNPPGDYAGRLIEVSGLKGHTIGGVQVSPVHANFIVNLGTGTASNYYDLIRYVQQAVSHQQGVQLELEIELLGLW